MWRQVFIWESTLVEVMAWHWKGDTPLPNAMMIHFPDVYVSLGLNGLIVDSKQQKNPTMH